MPERFVSLSMYAPAPEALTGFWRGLRRHMLAEGLDGIAEDLAQTDDPASLWTAPNLLLAQTCGYPLTHALRGRVRLVGTPCYSAAGCEGPLYSSAILVRAEDPAKVVADLAGRRAAFNTRDSQSGYSALRSAVAPWAERGRFFGGTIETRAHRLSMRAVGEGAADVAAVDCVTFALAAPRERAGLRVLAHTTPVPGLPLVTALATTDDDVARLRSAFAAACADPELAPERQAMLLDGFAVVPLEDYAVMLEMEAEARALGYAELA